jgi:Na+/H+ antiporter NhaD/arsenite permease-like protein
VVLRIALRRGLPPVPVLVGLACAANIGSAATLIGNPQNMLIGSVLALPFAAYLHAALPPVVLSLALLWAWLAWRLPRAGAAPQAKAEAAAPAADEPPFDAWQSAKGLAVAAALMGLFLFTEVPREVAALVGAAVLLLSRRLHSARVLGFVDWPLLLLFIGLFVVNHAFESTGLAAQAVAWLAARGLALDTPGVLLVAGVVLSNLVSNVPAVMLLLPHLQGFEAGLVFALVSTFAGNLLLVGSIANLNVADLAARDGIVIDWRAHAALGVPVTVASLAVLGGWMALGRG